MALKLIDPNGCHHTALTEKKWIQPKEFFVIGIWPNR